MLGLEIELMSSYCVRRAHLYYLDGYRVEFSCRDESHGRLAVFVRNDVVADIVKNRFDDGITQYTLHHRTACQTYSHAVYRPPSFDARRFLREIEAIAANVKKETNA